MVEKCTTCLVITESERRALLHGDKCRKAKSVLHMITEELSLNLDLTSNTYLCNLCFSKLDKLKTAENEVSWLKDFMCLLPAPPTHQPACTVQCSEIHVSLWLSVYFVVVKMATNSQQKLWWSARVALL